MCSGADRSGRCSTIWGYCHWSSVEIVRQIINIFVIFRSPSHEFSRKLGTCQKICASCSTPNRPKGVKCSQKLFKSNGKYEKQCAHEQHEHKSVNKLSDWPRIAGKIEFKKLPGWTPSADIAAQQSSQKFVWWRAKDHEDINKFAHKITLNAFFAISHNSSL